VPSLTVLVERSMPMKNTVIPAIVVATRGVMIWHQQFGPRRKDPIERVRSPHDCSLTRREWALLVGGPILLTLANYRESLDSAHGAG
jgi:hypothetical protein